MKKTTRAEVAAAFKAAKRHLVKNPYQYGSVFICFALQRAWCIESKGPPKRAFDKAARLVRARIAPYKTAERWLGSRLPGVAIPGADGNMPYQASERVQAWRHAWLDQLIEEFEAPDSLNT